MLERIYIPIKELLKDTVVKIKLEQVFQTYGLKLERFSSSPRSFAQYFALMEPDEMEYNMQVEIEKILAESDEKSPVLLETFYPFLKESQWKKSSSDISYFTVYAAKKEQLLYPVSEIEMKWDGKQYLFLVTDRDTLKQHCYQTKQKHDILIAMKKAFLEGIVAVELFQEKQ